jgi:hypothetical protein
VLLGQRSRVEHVLEHVTAKIQWAPLRSNWS